MLYYQGKPTAAYDDGESPPSTYTSPEVTHVDDYIGKYKEAYKHMTIMDLFQESRRASHVKGHGRIRNNRHRTCY